MRYRRQSTSSKDEDNKKDKGKGICYECGKPGHFRPDCLSLVNKKEKGQQNKSRKPRKAYVAWDSESEASSKEDSSESDEEANYCFMANQRRDKKNNVECLDSMAGKWILNSGCSRHMT